MAQVTYLEIGTSESHEVFLKNIAEILNTEVGESVSDHWEYCFAISEKHLSCFISDNRVYIDKGYNYSIDIYLYGISDIKIIEDSISWLFDKLRSSNRYKLLLTSSRSPDVKEYIPT